jgi:hypothetical protein
LEDRLDAAVAEFGEETSDRGAWLQRDDVEMADNHLWVYVLAVYGIFESLQRL